jgi:hypothetical protein
LEPLMLSTNSWGMAIDVFNEFTLSVSALFDIVFFEGPRFRLLSRDRVFTLEISGTETLPAFGQRSVILLWIFGHGRFSGQNFVCERVVLVCHLQVQLGSVYRSWSCCLVNR